MGGTAYGDAIRQTRALFEGGALGGLTDRELLARYAARPGDASESAFATIVARHGPMVLRACSALIGDEHAAHDAFQATFLVLAKKSGSVRVGESLGPWLHEVARRVSACARSASARRARHERIAAQRSPRTVEGPEVDDLAPVLHEEVGRLPERHKNVIILCDLEGLTHEQAAARLGWPLGTVRSRLARGRDTLRGRLMRRGLAPSAALAAPAALADAAVESVVRLAAGGPVSPTVGRLFAGGLRAMRMIHWKVFATLTLSAGLAATGVGALAARSSGRAAGPVGAPAGGGAVAVGDDPVGAGPVAPTPAEPPRPREFLVRYSESGRRVWGYSPVTGAWRTHNTPAGVKAVPTPRGGEDSKVLTALYLEGESITEGAVFDSTSGAWVVQALKPPVRGRCAPIIGRQYAIYRSGGHLYGYSSATGRWTTHDLGDEAAALAAREVPGDPDDLASWWGAFKLGRHDDKSVVVMVSGRYHCTFHVPDGSWDVRDVGRHRGDDDPLFVPQGERLMSFDRKTGQYREVETDEKATRRP